MTMIRRSALSENETIKQAMLIERLIAICLLQSMSVLCSQPEVTKNTELKHNTPSPLHQVKNAHLQSI